VIPFFDHTPAAPKICGITTHEDALGCIEAGAGALGFNFYPPSPRSIPVDGDLGWIAKLKADYPDIALVAVVVNPDEALLGKLRSAGCFDAIQFHGDESPEFCAEEGAHFPRWIRALRIRSQADLDGATAYRTPFLLLDAAVPGTYGGSGHTVDWSLAASFVAAHPALRVILAGGLSPDNVADAVSKVHPHAADVASGVESAPGAKDPLKVRDFITGAMTGHE
jgi:phosphoribosylanthranilate isomerase